MNVCSAERGLREREIDVMAAGCREEFPADPVKEIAVDRGGQRPGDGIREHQIFHGPIEREHKTDPQHAEDADPHHRDDRRLNGVTESAQRPADHIHDGAEEISCEENFHSQQSPGDHLFIGVVDCEKRMPEPVESESHDQIDGDGTAHAVEDAFADSAEFFSSQILTGETDDGLMIGVGPDIDDSFETERRGAACHRDRSERVDGGLNDEVGNGEKCSLQSGGETDPEHASENGSVDAQISEFQAACVARPGQIPDHEECRDGLREDGRQCDPRHLHPENQHENQIQHHIDNSREHQIIERSSRISCRAENCTSEVVQQNKRDSAAVDPEIDAGFMKDFGRSFRQFEHGF